jgi:hypothetical protein
MDSRAYRELAARRGAARRDVTLDADPDATGREH